MIGCIYDYLLKFLLSQSNAELLIHKTIFTNIEIVLVLQPHAET